MEREELKIKIREFVAVIKEKHNTNLSYDELNLMFSLYNEYFSRHDTPGCGNCNAAIWNSLKSV